MKVIYPPTADVSENTTIFLAGSIDMGTAIDWQQEVCTQLSGHDVTLFNPRRKDWNPSWPQDPSFAPFAEQVNWELNHIEKADYVLFYFAPNSKAPITFMELGLTLGSYWWKAIVCCPKDFYRRGNVEIVCKRYGITLYEDLDSAIAKLKTL